MSKLIRAPLVHFLLIGGVAFFLDGALRFRPLLPGRLPWLRLAPVLVASLAGLEELAQALSPYRSSTVSDFVADLLGVVCLSWLARRLSGWLERRRERAS